MSTAGRRVVLLDRDGVLNVDRPESVQTVAAFELIEGAAQAVARLCDAGYTILVVTNQACVGRGDVSAETLEAIHDRLRADVAAVGGRISRIYVCPHRDEDGCDCRKPKPGLVARAQRDFGFEPAETWLVGDDERDVLAARAAGCRPALVRTGKGAQHTAAMREVPVYRDLAAFAAERVS